MSGSGSASAILPAWSRKSPRVAEVLPLLYLHGLSSVGLRAGAGAVPRLGRGAVGGDDHPADRAVAGRGGGVQQAVAGRHRLRLLWVDGIHLKVRLEQDKVCLLVMIGVRADGTKELIALADGYRESTESWADLLPRSAGAAGCAHRCSRSVTVRWGSGRRCVRCSPTPGSSGAGSTSWRTCLPRCRSRRSRARRRRSPRSTTPRTATTPSSRSRRSRSTTAPSGRRPSRRSPTHLDVLLEFYNYPAEHWVHLRTTNPIESTFATVRLRQRVTKGPGSRAAGVAMAFKLIESAQSPVARGQRAAPRRPRPRRRHVREGQTRRTTRRIRRRATSRVTHRSTGLDYCSGLGWQRVSGPRPTVQPMADTWKVIPAPTGIDCH